MSNAIERTLPLIVLGAWVAALAIVSWLRFRMVRN